MNITCNQDNLYHQNYLNALRKEMGLPLRMLICDSIAYFYGRPTGIAKASGLAKMAVQAGKDIVDISFANDTTHTGVEFTVAFRLMDHVEILTRCKPFAPDADAPVVLLSADGARGFGADARGCMQQHQNAVTNISKGHALALRRIRATARELGQRQAAKVLSVHPSEVLQFPVHPAPMVVVS